MSGSSAAAGLDIDLGVRSSSIAYDWARRTHHVRDGLDGAPIKGQGEQFSGLIDVRGARVAITSDGIGTKIEVAERTGIYETLGHDLMAMVVDDLAANGIEAVSLSNILDVDRLDERVVDRLMSGLHDAATEARVAIVGGEIAELGARVGGWGTAMHFNWCATAIGLLAPGEDALDGAAVQEGDEILALRCRGLRSNGFSLARRTLAGHLGPDWHAARFDAARTWGEALLSPSRIYNPLVTALRRAGPGLRGVAHVTGGGIPDKLGRTLRASGLGADLDGLPAPHDFVLALQEMGKIPEDQAYRNWNMGSGMLLLVDPKESDRVLAQIAAAGHEGQRAGRVVREPVIRIQGRGAAGGVVERSLSPASGGTR